MVFTFGLVGPNWCVGICRDSRNCSRRRCGWRSSLSLRACALALRKPTRPPRILWHQATC
eukprot:7114471-Alexandrium_andersonii.AAC.1